MTYRVIQWFTGDIAKRQLRYLATRPDMTLVGAVAFHADKAGLDVGEVAGIGPVGVQITTDIDAALALEADCVLFNPLQWDPELAARILRSGKNIVTIRGAWYPRHEPEFQSLQEAGEAGGATIMGTGNMPGLINDALPLFAAGFTHDVRQIRTWQSTSPVAYGTRAVIEQLGIGQPASAMMDPANAVVAPVYADYFRQSAHLVAERFGLALDEFKLSHWKIGLAPKDVRIDALDYVIRQGTVAGFEIGFTGVVQGKPWYVHTVQHTWCLDIGEGWRARTDEPEWVVDIEGTPSLRFVAETRGGEDPWKSNNVLDLNASRMVNLIPAVCAAPPGCQTAFDAPLVVGTSLLD